MYRNLLKLNYLSFTIIKQFFAPYQGPKQNYHYAFIKKLIYAPYIFLCFYLYNEQENNPAKFT